MQALRFNFNIIRIFMDLLNTRFSIIVGNGELFMRAPMRCVVYNCNFIFDLFYFFVNFEFVLVLNFYELFSFCTIFMYSLNLNC